MERKVALFFNELREETGPSGQQGARGVGRGACGGAASSPGGVGTLISQGYICFQMKTRRAGVGQSTSVGLGGAVAAVESVGHCNCHSRTMGRFRNGDERAQYLIKRDLRLRNDNTAQCFSAASVGADSGHGTEREDSKGIGAPTPASNGHLARNCGPRR
jgi:hypothetical protein